MSIKEIQIPAFLKRTFNGRNVAISIPYLWLLLLFIFPFVIVSILSGSFNSSVIRLAEKEVEKFGKDNIQLFCLGKKASEHFSRRNYNIKLTINLIFKNWKF